MEDRGPRGRFSHHRCGAYVDQEIGAAGSTGRGEENIRVAGAHTIVENMRHGMAPKEACLDALKRVARNYNNDRAKLLQFDISFYALRRDGQYASASLWNGRKFTVNDGGESRIEPSAGLHGNVESQRRTTCRAILAGCTGAKRAEPDRSRRVDVHAGSGDWQRMLLARVENVK